MSERVEIPEKEIITYYLNKKNTDYAILLDGSWGSGKTYFWKNTIQPMVENNNLEHINNVIYISLYGLKSLVDIDKEIFLSKNITKEIDNKIFNYGSEFGKVLMRGFTSFNGVNLELDEIDFNKLYDLENTVLCFDDLERTNISVNKILGYINKFVEHDNNVKVVIIANEKEINKLNFSNKNFMLKFFEKLEKTNTNEDICFKSLDKKIDIIFDRYSKYKKIKEKVIGKTIHFNLKEKNYRNILIDIINENINEKKYNKYLNDNIEIILSLFLELPKEENLRSFKHGLQDFKLIYMVLDKYNNLEESYINKFLIGELIIYNLYRSNSINEDNLKNFDTSPMNIGNNTIKLSSLLNENILNELNSIYFDNYKDALLTPSIINYIKTGYFNKKSFKDEIEEFLDEDKISDFNMIITNWWNLTDEEFKRHWHIIIQKARNGEYKILDYAKLYSHYITFCYKNIIGKPNDSIKNKLIKGLEKSCEKQDYSNLNIQDLDHIKTKIEIIFQDKEFECFEEELNNFKNDLISLTKKIIEKNNKRKANKLLNVFKNDFSKFEEEVINNKKYNNTPIFNYLSKTEFSDVLKNLSNEGITNLNRYIEYKFKLKSYNLNKEASFLCDIKRKINKYKDDLDKKKYKLKIYLLSDLVQTIEKRCCNSKVTNNKDKK